MIPSIRSSGSHGPGTAGNEPTCEIHVQPYMSANKHVTSQIFICESTHRLRTWETGEEICESEKAQSKKSCITVLISATHRLQSSPKSFRFCTTFTAVRHLAVGT